MQDSGLVTSPHMTAPDAGGHFRRSEPRCTELPPLVSMKSLIAYVPIVLVSCKAFATQQPTVDTPVVHRVERIDRHQAIDSLAAGRRRWLEARIVEYRLQTSHRCFCMPNPDDSLRGSELLTIANGRISERSPGKGPDSYVPSTSWTVDSLFDIVEADLVNNWGKVRRLELDPEYGFPVGYMADGVAYEDSWIEITVDSFAVVGATARCDRRRSR